VAGWAYQWLARLDFARDSWRAPLNVRWVRPAENANAAAVEQIKGQHDRQPPAAAAPLFVFDAGYDSAYLTQGPADTAATVLVRIRSDRCIYADLPPTTPSPKGGRPRRHGVKFDCADPETWSPPTAEHVAADAQYRRPPPALGAPARRSLLDPAPRPPGGFGPLARRRHPD
jgi:hypothetical protein